MPTNDADLVPVTDGDIIPRTEETPARPYIRVRPTDEPLTPATVYAHMRRLHGMVDRSKRWYQRLLPQLATSPMIECLLVSDGRDDAEIRYYFGIDTDDTDALERVLRGLFPDSYEFDHAEWHPDRLFGDPTEFDSRAEDEDDRSTVVGVEFRGLTERHDDWQTRLTPFDEFHPETDRHHTRVALAAIIEIMTASTVPIVYQVLLRSMPDWSGLAVRRGTQLKADLDTPLQMFLSGIFRDTDDDSDTLSDSHRERLEELDEKDHRSCFRLNARAISIARTEDEREIAQNALDEISAALGPVSQTTYRIRGKIADDSGSPLIGAPISGRSILEDVRERTFHTRGSILQRWLPLTLTSRPVIVADPVEAPNFCIIGGDALTAMGGRAIAPTPGERTPLPRPPVEQLAAYRDAGLTLGRPLTQDGTPDEELLVLPPELQPLHIAWFGKTGSGKSTSLITAILDNHAATEGASILIDPKGDGMPDEYLRAHYARFGHLNDVQYFNCAEVLPAFSFFDIRDELDAGIPRTTAVEDTVDHYIEILVQIMGQERFDQAVRSPDVIRYLVKAAFDPVNGGDAFSHRDLHELARRMHERQTTPAVSDDDLERMLGGVVANRARTFDEIMAGVANRLEKIPVDRRLARIFNHVPREGDPHFDLADYLDENVIIIFDTGDLRSEARRVLALVILSNLWTALRRRKRRSGDSETDHPLVNLYIEEAASIAVSDLFKSLLAQSRGFDCSVTLAMQFPAQIRALDETAYDEVLNNISTFVTGNVPVDRQLAERLATDDMDARSVGNRLRALRRGQWLVSLPAAFDHPEPRPFLVGSTAPPPGDPDGPRPLSRTERHTFDATLEHARDRTREEAGLTLVTPSTVDGSEAEEEETTPPLDRIDSALPHTKRLPTCMWYDPDGHALRCLTCDNRYDASIDGVKRAIECCSSLEDVDRDDIPICDLNLKLTPDERAASEWSDHQLMFLQAVYNAQQLRYDPLEYDLLHDSMLRLQEYVGIESDTVQDLIDADLLRHDTDHPHRLYTVTPDGRTVIGESYRQGVDYGHGAGDLEESSAHVFAVEVARQYLEQAYAENPDSSVVEVQPYYELDEQRRLDIAGLDENGDIVVAVEAERVNHDVKRAVPEDFDKMASVEPEEAIWIVMSQAAGHQVLTALNEPLDGEPRVEKTYAETTPPQQFRIDTPGMTAIYPAEYVRDSLLESTTPS